MGASSTDHYISSTNNSTLWENAWNVQQENLLHFAYEYENNEKMLHLHRLYSEDVI